MDIILNYSAIKESVEELNQLIEESQSLRLQKAYSSPHYLILEMRGLGKTYFLYVGRGNHHQGLYLADKKVPPEMRVRDRFLEYARSHWVGLKISSVKMYDDDRIVIFKGQTGQKKKGFAFFWRGRDFFFFDYDESMNKNFFSPWKGGQLEGVEFEEALNEELKELGVRKVDRDEKRTEKRPDVELYIDDFFKQHMSKQSSKKLKAKKEKRVDRIKNDIAALNEMIFMQGEVKGLESLADEFKLGKRVIKFRNKETFFQKRDILFLKIKSAKNGLKIQTERLRKLESDQSEEVGKKGSRSVKPQVKIIQPIWSDKKVNASIVKPSEGSFRIYSFPFGLVAIGKTARENDEIRSKWARKEDIWFHLDEQRSAHAVLRLSDEQLLVEYIGIVASMVADNSSQEFDKVPILYTKVKYLKSVKGFPGKVRFKNEKRMLCNYTGEWQEKYTLT
jgi:predicted ribosome quality control (RQC) complex YloA/Tae2 family protein